MAEFRIKILADLRQLKKDLSDTVKKKFKIDVGAKGAGPEIAKTQKEEKKQTSSLLEGVGLLAIIAGVLKSMQPIMDALKLFFGLVALGILKLVKFIVNVMPKIIEFLKALPGRIWEFLKALPGRIWEFVKGLASLIWEKVKGLASLIWGFLKVLPGKIWNFVKGLALKIWELLKIGFTWLVEKLKLVWGIIKEKLKILKDKLVVKLKELKDKFVVKLKELKDKIIELKDKLVEKLKELPGKIWEFMAQLPSLIANALKGLFRIGGGKKKSVGDAIIKPDGTIIRTDPNDTLIATRTPGAIGGGKVFNFYGVTPQAMIEVIKRELGTDLLKSGRF